MTRIYVHGLGQTSRSWDAVLTGISSDENTICPNLPELLDGKAARYPNLYDAFSELCDGIDGPLTLCGLSLGAVLALHYAVKHPKKSKVSDFNWCTVQNAEKTSPLSKYPLSVHAKIYVSADGFWKKGFSGTVQIHDAVGFH